MKRAAFLAGLVAIACISAVTWSAISNRALRQKEAILKGDLFEMRMAIDKWYAETGQYPESLRSLVEAGHLKSVPVDPFTNSDRTWVLVSPQAAESVGIINVLSGASGIGHDGTQYDEW